jgi:transglutaminase-like putative cysteine protease
VKLETRLMTKLFAQPIAAATLLLALAAAGPATAQEPQPPADDDALRALIDDAGTTEDLDGADLVTVFKRTHVDVEDSGLGHIRNHEVIKCLTEAGAGQMARFRLDFDPASNYVEVKRLRVIRADGAIEDLALDSGVDLPQPQFAIYWGAQMKLVPIPRLNIGDAVEIETYMKGFLIAYLDEMQAADGGGGGGGGGIPAGGWGGPAPEGDERYIPPMRGHFYDVVYFHAHHPVKLRHYTVVTPRDKPVQFEVYNGEIQSYVSYDEDTLRYSFWREDQPAFHEEERAVDFPDVQTKVVLATLQDWPSKSRWFFQVNDEQFDADPAVEAKVAELTGGLRSDEDKISAIVHWSADDIRYSGISMGHGEGYILHEGADIFHDRSGVCKDKAGIAITMLRAAGYTVYPAMTMAGSRVERIPADQFNHCVVALKKDDGSYMMLDPTWVTFSPEEWSSAEGEQHYVIGSPEGEELMQMQPFDPADNLLRVDASSTLAEDGSLSGNVEFSGKGYAGQRLRREMVHYSTAVDRQAWFQQAIGHLDPGAKVSKVGVTYPQVQDVTTPIRYEVDYRVPDYALAGEDTLYFAPPTATHLVQSGRIAPYLDCAGPEERTQDLLLWAPRMRQGTETITLPAGYKVTQLPADRDIDGPIASLKTTTEVKGRKLVYTYELVIKRRQIPVEHYGNFREVVQEALALPDDLIVLEKK